MKCWALALLKCRLIFFLTFIDEYGPDFPVVNLPPPQRALRYEQQVTSQLGSGGSPTRPNAQESRHHNSTPLIQPVTLRQRPLLNKIHRIPSPSSTHLNSKIPLRKMPLPLLLLLRDQARLLLRQAPPHGARLLRAQVEGHVLLVFVEDAELGALVGVDDGEDAGDGFADIVAVEKKGLG